MTIKPFPGFHSLETHHCVTGSMLHVYHAYDHKVSEELLFGLGAGIGFVYWHQKGMPPMFGGRANVGRPGEEGLEVTSGRRTGVQVNRASTSSRRNADRSLRLLLEDQRPVMILVDMGFLPYFEDLPEDFHFGHHMVVVCGYDAEQDKVLIADRDRPLHTVAWETLAQARGSTFKPFPPHNTWFEFDFQDKRDPTVDEIWKAISDSCSYMLDGPISNLGVRGIRKAANRSREWHQQMSVEELQWACFNVYMFIDAAGGTGGGIFRWMYARFLEEAAERTGLAELAELAEATKAVGDRWQSVAEIFHQAARLDSPHDLIVTCNEPLLEIADLEESIWKHLRILSKEQLTQYQMV